MSSLTRLSLIAFVVSAFGAQQARAQEPLRFEVASVHSADSKPQGPMRIAGQVIGGPGTAEPTRITYRGVPVRYLLTGAFGVPLDQISGSDWVMGQDARFDIVANVPEGATKDQINEMLLNLLKDRFHFAFHREKKDFDMYALVVAKGGSKLKDAAPADGPPPEPPARGRLAKDIPLDRDGFPQLPAGYLAVEEVINNGVTRISFRMATPQLLLSMLRVAFGSSRTVDKTGLTGKYDFTLEFSAAGLPGPMGQIGPPQAPSGQAPAATASEPEGPDLFTALEKQLGLKLEKSKTQLDVFVVDRMDKTPTEN